MRSNAVRFAQSALFLAIALTPNVLLGQEAPFQAAFGDRTLVLQEEDGTWFLQTLGEEGRPLAVPTGATPSALTALGNRWLAAGSAVGEDGVRRLILLRGDEDSFRPVKIPKRQRGRLRQGAVPLVENGRLKGLAWLEGDDRRGLEVRASVWTGRRWRRPRVVAAAGPGSQLALSGTVLADGSWLLAWSAFDGKDDEILTARRIGRHWLDPEAPTAGNDVPDITPALVASGTGALLAWSRFDGGEYRLVQARFDGSSWVEETFLGEGGTLYPRYLDGNSDGAVLVYRDARSRGWAALELSADGVPAHYLMAPGTGKTRPVVETSRDGARLHWMTEGEVPQELPWSLPGEGGELGKTPLKKERAGGTVP